MRPETPRQVGNRFHIIYLITSQKLDSCCFSLFLLFPPFYHLACSPLERLHVHQLQRLNWSAIKGIQFTRPKIDRVAGRSERIKFRFVISKYKKKNDVPGNSFSTCIVKKENLHRLLNRPSSFLY